MSSSLSLNASDNDLLQKGLEQLKLSSGSPVLQLNEDEIRVKDEFGQEDGEDFLSLDESFLEKFDLEVASDLNNFKIAFQNFLESNPGVLQNAEIVPEGDKSLIVLSPLSLEHFFARNWVSKRYISTIVERPQRLLAVSIGIAAALSIYPSSFTLLNSTKLSPLDSSHVIKVHGKNWPAEIERLSNESREKLKDQKLEVPDDWNSGDIYINPHTVIALKSVIGAVETAVDSVFSPGADSGLSPKRSFVVIRPPGHHSHPCLPSGFCLINNVQIGIQYAFEKYDVTHAVILDIDLHHGDGTQDICWLRGGWKPEYGDESLNDEPDNLFDEYEKRSALNGPKVGYFSLHDINSFPTESGFATQANIKNASTCIAAHDLYIWNVHLKPYKDLEDFNRLYERRYIEILRKAEEFLLEARNTHSHLSEKSFESNGKIPAPSPFKAIVMISAGFDGSEYETPSMQRHDVNVPTSFYQRFTKDAIKLSNLYSNGKLISFLEGGYSDGALVSGTFSHLVGLQNKTWNDNWTNETVIKDLTKGCKPKWTALKKPAKTETSRWSNEVIKLGRAMIPKAIIDNIPNGSAGNGTLSRSKMLKELIDSDSIASRIRRSHAKEIQEQSIDNLIISGPDDANNNDIDDKENLNYFSDGGADVPRSSHRRTRNNVYRNNEAINLKSNASVVSL